MKCSEIKGSHQNSSHHMLYSRLFTSIVSRCSEEYSIAPYSPLMVEILLLRKMANTTLSGSLLLLFWPVIWLAGSWLPNQGSNACPCSRTAEA